jgi:hypothetical protein
MSISLATMIARLNQGRQQHQKSFGHLSELGDTTSGRLGPTQRTSPYTPSRGLTLHRRRTGMSSTMANLLLLLATSLRGFGNIAQKSASPRVTA